MCCEDDSPIVTHLGEVLGQLHRAGAYTLGRVLHVRVAHHALHDVTRGAFPVAVATAAAVRVGPRARRGQKNRLLEMLIAPWKDATRSLASAFMAGEYVLRLKYMSLLIAFCALNFSRTYVLSPSAARLDEARARACRRTQDNSCPCRAARGPATRHARAAAAARRPSAR